MAIEIFSKNNCSYCDKAKQLLRIHGKDYIEYKLDEDFTREVLLSRFPEAKSYPIIVVDGFNIGGFEQLNKYITEEAQDSRKLLNEGI